MLERVLGHVVVRQYHHRRLFDVPVSILDNTLARQELGWKPLVGLEAGIVKTVEWMRVRPCALCRTRWTEKLRQENQVIYFNEQSY